MLVCRSSQLQSAPQLTGDFCFKPKWLHFAPHHTVSAAPEWTWAVLTYPASHLGTVTTKYFVTMWGGLLLGERGAGRGGWGLKRDTVQPLTSREASLGCSSFKRPRNICPLTASSRLVKQQRDLIYLGLVESLRTQWRLLLRIQQLQEHLRLVLFHLHFSFILLIPAHSPFWSRIPFPWIIPALVASHSTYWVFPLPPPAWGLHAAEVWGGFSLETDAGMDCLKQLRFSTQSAQQVLLGVFPLKQVWRSGAEDGESRAVKQGKERDEIPVICLLQPSPSGWGRKQPSAAEKTVLRFIALADSQRKISKEVGEAAGADYGLADWPSSKKSDRSGERKGPKASEPLSDILVSLTDKLNKN